jgi:hypothetical protein
MVKLCEHCKTLGYCLAERKMGEIEDFFPRLLRILKEKDVSKRDRIRRIRIEIGTLFTTTLMANGIADRLHCPEFRRDIKRR